MLFKVTFTIQSKHVNKQKKITILQNNRFCSYYFN